MSFPAKLHPNPLASARALVVGGSSGLGAGVVSALLANGANVHIASSSSSKIETKIKEFKALYPDAKITGTAANLSDENTLEDAVKKILEDAVAALGGPLDHLVYTAGDAVAHEPLSALDATTYFKKWNVRFLAPLFFGKLIGVEAGKYMTSQQSSSITFSSGLLVHKPTPGVAQLIAWGGALEALARGLAVDLAPVRVNVVAPGAIKTELFDTLPDFVQQGLGDKTLFKKVGLPSEAAEAYLYSMRGGFTTGEIIQPDGGYFLV